MIKFILAELNYTNNLKGKNLEDLTQEERNSLIISQKLETIKKIKELEDDSIEMDDQKVF
jgi:hypothetical protein